MAIIAYGTWQYLYTHDRERMGFKKPLPTDGVAKFDTHGLVPGDPKNGERSLKNLYALIQIHLRNGGTLSPRIANTVMDEAIQHPERYGFRDDKAVMAYLANPDNKFNDEESVRQVPNVPGFGGIPIRPDGTIPFTAKATGTRDILAYSTTYLHTNQRDFSGSRTTLNPVGFYQVLWEDGTVEQIPYDKPLFIMASNASTSHNSPIAFPGQAGIPKYAVTYDQMWAKAGWKKGPRGVPNGKGVAYNGQSYR